MEWHELFDKTHQPEFSDMENFIGGRGVVLWKELFAHMQKSYNAKPKMTYSTCSGKPGWNVKFQKSGQSFGTLYPEKNAFSVFVVIAYKLDGVMKTLKPKLSAAMRARFDAAQDYMKVGRWMMFQVTSKTDLNDYIVLMSAKMEPKA